MNQDYQRERNRRHREGLRRMEQRATNKRFPVLWTLIGSTVLGLLLWAVVVGVISWIAK